LLKQSGIKLKAEREKWFRKYAEEKKMNEWKHRELKWKRFLLRLVVK
jgi:hypothetical protein